MVAGTRKGRIAPQDVVPGDRNHARCSEWASKGPGRGRTPRDLVLRYAADRSSRPDSITSRTYTGGPGTPKPRAILAPVETNTRAGEVMGEDPARKYQGSG